MNVVSGNEGAGKYLVELFLRSNYSIKLD